MKKVLVPIDGSETSLRAVHILMQKRTFYRDPADLEIHLLNVQPSVPGDVNMFVAHDEVKQYHHDEGLKALQPARELLDKENIAYIYHICVGEPGHLITHYALDQGCDQIIMGTHGRGELAGLLFGSVTRKVIHLAKVPVLLVK